MKNINWKKLPHILKILACRVKKKRGSKFIYAMRDLSEFIVTKSKQIVNIVQSFNLNLYKGEPVDSVKINQFWVQSY